MSKAKIMQNVSPHRKVILKGREMELPVSCDVAHGARETRGRVD